MSKYKYVCNRCQSVNVYQHCDAMWSVNTQSWFISDTWNNYYCHVCDRETLVDKLAIEGETS